MTYYGMLCSDNVSILGVMQMSYISVESTKIFFFKCDEIYVFLPFAVKAIRKKCCLFALPLPCIIWLGR